MFIRINEIKSIFDAFKSHFSSKTKDTLKMSEQILGEKNKNNENLAQVKPIYLQYRLPIAYRLKITQ